MAGEDAVPISRAMTSSARRRISSALGGSAGVPVDVVPASTSALPALFSCGLFTGDIGLGTANDGRGWPMR